MSLTATAAGKEVIIDDAFQLGSPASGKKCFLPHTSQTAFLLGEFSSLLMNQLQLVENRH